MPDSWCPKCGYELTDFDVQETGQCWSCGFKFGTETHNIPVHEMPNRGSQPTAAVRVSALRFAYALLAPALAGWLLSIFGNDALRSLPFIRTFLPFQFVGFGMFAIACAVYCGVQIGSGRSLCWKLLGGLVSLVLIVANTAFVVAAGCSVH